MASSFTYPKYIGYKAKYQRVQWDGGAIAGAINGAVAPNAPAWLRAWVQHNFRRTLLHMYCHLGRRISIALEALRYSITSGARYYCHLGKKV